MRLQRMIIWLVVLISPALAVVRLPRLISDGMVLQRDTRVVLWGWADAQEPVSVQFMDSLYTTTADDHGDWQIVLSNLRPGGPHDLIIKAGNTLTLRDVLVGDVWVCSGQSNMELPMRRVAWKYPREIAACENANIRHFAVPQRYDFKTPQADVFAGNWTSANPATVLDFSATAYFFAAELYAKYKVPIGLINASLGGSPAEAWMSAEALKQFPVHLQEAQRFQDDALIAGIENADRARNDAWYRLLRQKDEGYKNPQLPWSDPSLCTDSWERMSIPNYWSHTELGPVNGVVWFRKKVIIPAVMAGKPAQLILGRIVDADSCFVNGLFVGAVSYQYPPRRYDIPPGLLREGENILVVRVISNAGAGGFVPDKSYQIIADGDTLDVTGIWQYRRGAVMEPLASQTFIRWKPLGLFNAMIAPLLKVRIRGVIWYQGESNTGRSQEYRTLFPALIRDWRSHWNQGDFPFLFVQLPNFMEPQNRPGDGGWVRFREAQAQALALPNTAMAVAIDLGEWNDVHPLNKKDVGMRLALAARRVAYGENIVHAGPLFKAMRRKGNKLVLTFDHAGSGLMTMDGGPLKHFAIAGADKNFVWAKARIDKKRVVVWADGVKKPVAVRYAWADNPQGANLYNKEGLPAAPFRSDGD